MDYIRRAVRLIWCGLCQADHTPAELAECLKNNRP